MNAAVSRRAILAAIPLALTWPSLADAGIPPVTHRQVEVNGVTLHIAEQGTGPLVILCHGWPQCWNSWHHQMAAPVAWTAAQLRPDIFRAHLVRLSQGTVASKMAATYCELAPGEGTRICPYHLHHAQEEMFVILEGTGTLRVAGESKDYWEGEP